MIFTLSMQSLNHGLLLVVFSLDLPNFGVLDSFLLISFIILLDFFCFLFIEVNIEVLFDQFEDRYIPKMRSNSTDISELGAQLVVGEQLNNSDFILLAIFMEPAIPSKPYFISLIIFMVDDFIILWAYFLKRIGEFGGEASDNIGFGDRCREDRDDDRFFAQGSNPSDISLEYCLGDLGFIIECLIVAHEVEINLSKYEQDGFIWGLSYNCLYFLSFLILFLHQSFD